MKSTIPMFKDIEYAADRINSYIIETPILESSLLNDKVGGRILLKAENLQRTGSFKYRGALNTTLQLNENERKNGVVAYSSGNHAQAVALASKIAKTKAYIVMPKGAPQIKIDAVKGYGGFITLCDNNEKSRVKTCDKIINKTGATFIHPYNNDDVIFGQSTCAKEIYEKKKNLDYLICPVGGGGLASGTILSTKVFSPQTKIVLAEPLNADDAFRSFYSKKLIPVENPNTIADGLKTSLGEKTFKIIIDGAEEILTVTEEEIIYSMKLIWERLKVICEPSCSLPLAVVLKNPKKFHKKSIGIILTGGNVDLTNLPF